MKILDVCRDGGDPRRRCRQTGCRCEGRYPFGYEAAPGETRFIHLDGSPVLRRRAVEVDPCDDVTPLVKAMFATMRAAGGIGLSAPQIGVALRLAIVEVDGVSWTLINPEITSHSDRTDVEDEGCLSLPGRWGQVLRPYDVAVVTSLHEDPFLAAGRAGRALQHELDHLDGVLFTDRVIAGTLRTDGRAWRPHPVGPLTPLPVYVEDGAVMCPGCGLVAPWGDTLAAHAPVMCHGFKDADGTGRCHAVLEVRAQTGWRSWL